MANHWRNYAKRTKTLESKYIPAITRLITRYRSKFIAAYKQNPSSARTALQGQVMNEEVAKLVQSIYKTAGLMGAKLTNDEIKKSATLKAAGFGRNDIWIRDVIAYLKLHMLKFVSDITDTMRDDILKILEKAVENGWGIAETVRELERTNLVRSRARVIARTEINRAANVGHSIAAQSLPYEVDKEWIAAEDHRTRASHKQINNHRVGENDYFKVKIYKGDKFTGAYDEMSFPGDPSASAGNTINCFLPDELTFVNPEIIEHAFRNRYKGEVVTIHTSGGKKFTCTPNHPILTTSGWLAAGNLAEGDNLVKSNSIQHHTLPDLNVKDIPSSFKKIYDSLSIVGVTMRMPRVVVDFYGDVPTSDVDIIRPASKLPDGIKSSVLEFPNENIFKYSSFGNSLLFTNSLFNGILFMKFRRLISNYFMGFKSVLASLFRSGLRHPEVHRFATVTGSDASLFHSPVDDISTNPVFFSQLFNAGSGIEITDNTISRNFDPITPHFNDISQSLMDESRTKAKDIPDFLKILSGLIESDSIVKVERRYYSGHVYTFETSYQIYDINTYVARNCRCRVIYKARRDSQGRLILRDRNQATIIPMRQPRHPLQDQIAAILKSNISISVK